MTHVIVDNLVYLSGIQEQQEKHMSSLGYGNLSHLSKQFSSALILSALASLSSAAAYAGNAEGAALFQSKCAACHSIGKGTLVGPDLAPGKSWKEDNLQASIKRMEKTVGALSEQDVSDLMAFLKNPPSAESATKSTAVPDESKAGAYSPESAKSEASAPAEIKSGSAVAGGEYFDGRRSFQNGGMACNACHTLDGSSGSLGPDLGKISERMNEAALLAACKQAPFKIMKSAYANHKLTEQEAMDLVKYFESIKDQKPAAEKFPVSLAGAAGTLLIIFAVALGYSKRNSGVRKKLHRR